jgi:prefoldin subunit 5
MMIFIIAALGINLFFISSKALFDRKQVFKYTEYDHKQTFDNRDVTLAKWVYCKASNSMEVELDVSNKNYNGKDSYDFKTIDRAGKSYPTKVIISSPTITVVQISNVPEKFKELRLTQSLPGTTDLNNEKETLKWYTNQNYVEQVEQIITYTSMEKYYVAKLDRYIEDYTEQINAIKSNIDQKNKEIENYNTLITDLVIKKAYAAGNELVNINNQINDTNNLIAEVKTDILALDKEILDINGKISDYENIKRLYEPGTAY